MKAISQNSGRVLSDSPSETNRLHSYVTENKTYCVYAALNEEMIREHGCKGGFPVTSFTQTPPSSIRPQPDRNPAGSQYLTDLD